MVFMPLLPNAQLPITSTSGISIDSKRGQSENAISFSIVAFGISTVDKLLHAVNAQNPISVAAGKIAVVRLSQFANALA